MHKKIEMFNKKKKVCNWKKNFVIITKIFFTAFDICLFKSIKKFVLNFVWTFILRTDKFFYMKEKNMLLDDFLRPKKNKMI